MGGVGSVGAWVRGWRGKNFDIGRIGRVGPQSFCMDQKNGMSRNFGVGETYDLINFCYDSLKFYL